MCLVYMSQELLSKSFNKMQSKLTGFLSLSVSEKDLIIFDLIIMANRKILRALTMAMWSN